MEVEKEVGGGGHSNAPGRRAEEVTCPGRRSAVCHLPSPRKRTRAAGREGAQGRQAHGDPAEGEVEDAGGEELTAALFTHR